MHLQDGLHHSPSGANDKNTETLGTHGCEMDQMDGEPHGVWTIEWPLAFLLDDPNKEVVVCSSLFHVTFDDFRRS